MKATFVLGALLALTGAAASPVERRRLEPRVTISPNATSSDVASASSDVASASSASSASSTSSVSSFFTTASAVQPKCRPKSRSSSSAPSAPTPSGPSDIVLPSVLPSSSANGTAPTASPDISASVAPTAIQSAPTPAGTPGEAPAASGSGAKSDVPTAATPASSSESSSASSASASASASSVSTAATSSESAVVPASSQSAAPSSGSSAAPSSSSSPATTSSQSPSPTTLSPAPGNASRPDAVGEPAPASGSSDKLVFAHFMVGITWPYQQSDWEADIRKAQSYGVDAFALNIGRDDYNHAQLTNAYNAAEALGFKVFLSFDFNWWKNDQVADVVSYLKEWASKPAQLKVKANNAAFVSTFIGAGFDWASVKQQVGFPLHVIPGNLRPDDAGTQSQIASAALDGLFSWHAWPGQENNIPVDASLNTDTDKAYQALVGKNSKDYMAPVSPWFFTHIGSDKSYTKNFLFKSEQLWHYRWQQILDLAPQYVEIVTWNDFGESHHVGPRPAAAGDDGSADYAAGLDHTRLMDLAVPFIKAYKAGSNAPVVEKDFVVYWHRPHLKSASCDATDPVKGSASKDVQPGGVPAGKPQGWEFVADVVFVAVSSKAGAKVTVTSGSNAPVTLDAQAGIQVFEVPMGTGQQKFELSSGAGSASGTSEVPITAGCWQNKLYNFNFHSGLVSA